MKKNFDYFACLARQAAIVRSCMELLCRGDIFALEKTQARLRELAQESLGLRRELTDTALEDFLPPLEREDLLAVSQEIYALAHAAETALHSSFAVPQAEAAQRIMQQCEALERCMTLLDSIQKNSAQLLAQARRIEDLALEPSPAPYAAAFKRLAAALERTVVKNI